MNYFSKFPTAVNLSLISSIVSFLVLVITIPTGIFDKLWGPFFCADQMTNFATDLFNQSMDAIFKSFSGDGSVTDDDFPDIDISSTLAKCTPPKYVFVVSILISVGIILFNYYVMNWLWKSKWIGVVWVWGVISVLGLLMQIFTTVLQAMV